MRLFSFLFAVILLVSIQSVVSWRQFWKGRKFGGNIGDPSKFHVDMTSSTDSEDLWHEQKLDHFNPKSDKRWKQRYFVNDKYFKSPNGPVFLMIGGEGEATAKWMRQGAWIHYAQEVGALCFQLEHRYYGKSHPTDDLSTENLLFLASEQALADLAYFITEMNSKYNLTRENSWIAFGGSYPGTLAAWLRKRYAHLVVGSISTSGPLLAKTDFSEYFEVVVKSLGTYKKSDCVTPVKQAFSQIDVLLKHMIGQRTLNERFQLCDPVEKSVTNPLDIANLYENIAGDFAGVVQYNKDNRPGSVISIDDVCDLMTNQTIGPPVTRLGEVNKMLLKASNQTCLDYKYDKMIDEMRNVSWDAESSEGGRQWTYQTCTEFGFYQTSSDPDSVFGDKFPVEFFVRQCKDIFGEKFDAETLKNAIEMTNLVNGALYPQTTNVLYVHGSIDPWHALGLTETNYDQPQPTIYIDGTAHCANMYEPSDKDFPQLKDARVLILKFIKDLLK